MDIDQGTLPHLNLEKLLNTSKFLGAAETEDELGCVLRIHLCLESLLEEYLKNFIPPEERKYHKERLGFAEKLSLGVAYRLPVSIAEPIRIINKLRNRYAHADNPPLNDKQISELADLVDKVDYPGKDKNFTVKRTYVEFCVTRPGEKLKFGEHGARIDFVLISSYLLGNATKWLVSDYIRRFPELVVSRDPNGQAEGQIPS